MMKRAIDAGTKTQTRREAKAPKKYRDVLRWDVSHVQMFKSPQGKWPALAVAVMGTGEELVIHPKHHVGDVLYVKEGLRRDKSDFVEYESDGEPVWRDGAMVDWPWKPEKLAAMYMPKWAARTRLEITDVRLERLTDCSEADAIAEGMGQQLCADVFDEAAGKVQLKYCRWIENDVEGESDPECAEYCPDCAVKVAKRMGKDWGVHGWNNAEESDGPAMCGECGAPLMMSLSTHGIDSELRFTETDDAEERGRYPVRGGSARIAHMIADGIGDLREEHMGRLAKIAYATMWESHNGKGSWAKSPWVFAYTFRPLPSTGAE